MVAVSGFTTILGSFCGIGTWARLSSGRGVLDVPFNPTYGLSLSAIMSISKVCDVPVEREAFSLR